jgi:hypothetical protein
VSTVLIDRRSVRRLRFFRNGTRAMSHLAGCVFKWADGLTASPRTIERTIHHIEKWIEDTWNQKGHRSSRFWLTSSRAQQERRRRPNVHSVLTWPRLLWSKSTANWHRITRTRCGSFICDHSIRPAKIHITAAAYITSSLWIVLEDKQWSYSLS